MDYRYLFPFEKVEKGDRIVIYGAGLLGQEYLKQIRLTGYCEVVALADKNYQHYPDMGIPVIAPEDIHLQKFDKVILAIRTAISFHEMSRILAEQGIPEKKLVCVFERALEDNGMAGTANFPQHCRTDRIALLLKGGIGDSIIQKRWLRELLHYIPEYQAEIFNINNVEFLEYLYQDMPNVCGIVRDLGMRYRAACREYALALTVEACHFIKVDWFCEEIFKEGHPDFVRRVKKLQEETQKENADLSTPMHLTNLTRLYLGCNCYTGFNYHGAFDVRDKQVGIPLTEKGRREFEALSLRQYMTVNYGNGDCRDGSKVAKSWPKWRFEEVIADVHGLYPDLQVVQVGMAGAEKLQGADACLFGRSFDSLAYVLKNAVLHLDIEGGLVHMASQLGTKCVVLFGPTVEEYYGYEKNTNIRAGTCRNCWGLYSDVNRCARGLKEPECMYAITPKMVVKEIKAWMDSKEAAK